MANAEAEEANDTAEAANLAAEVANDEAEEANEKADAASSDSEDEMHSVKESGDSGVNQPDGDNQNDQGETEQ